VAFPVLEGTHCRHHCLLVLLLRVDPLSLLQNKCTLELYILGLKLLALGISILQEADGLAKRIGADHCLDCLSIVLPRQYLLGHP
jgi:hypothetical protein